MPHSNPIIPAELAKSDDEPGPARGYIERFGVCMLRWLKTGNPAATIDRLFISKHVGDLRNIVSVALLLLITGAVLCLVYAGEAAVDKTTALDFIKVFFPTLFSLLTPLFAIFGAIGAWAYKVGSLRLGVVDLFACEISTLCRVALVTDTVNRLTERIERAKVANDIHALPAEPAGKAANPADTLQFTSTEDYFPVSEGNTSDLQSLEARVVINITSFYTFMKAVRDLLRKAATLKPGSVHATAENPDRLQADTWHNAMRDVVYMLFLGLEARRNSVEDLVEFEPEQAERTVVILLSELSAYLFLLQEFAHTDDMRERRLLLRWPAYQKLLAQLGARIGYGSKHATARLDKARTGKRPQTEVPLRELDLTIWQGAEKIWPDLQRLYQNVGAFIAGAA